MNKNSTTDVRFALYEYSNSTNIGDEIQSIAARRFLPQVDYFINRDEAGNWSLPRQKEAPPSSVRLIANGWYMSKPFAWPVRDSSIDPLLVSVHVEAEMPKVKDVFSSPESVAYFESHQPIGCRDTSTEKFLQGLGIETYFSGCLTLTLQRDPRIKKEDFILAAGVSDKVYEKIKQQTNRVVIRIDSHSENKNSFETAEKYLYLYQSAHCVVTSRLHAMLPCLALETPVLFLSDGAMTASMSRFDGLQELTCNLSEVEYISEPLRYDVNNPPGNPATYKAVRDELIKKCRQFTGHDNRKTFARDIDFAKFSLVDCIDVILYNQDYLSGRVVQAKDAQIASLQHEKRHLQDDEPSVRKSLKQLAGSLRRYVDRHFLHK